MNFGFRQIIKELEPTLSGMAFLEQLLDGEDREMLIILMIRTEDLLKELGELFLIGVYLILERINGKYS